MRPIDPYNHKDQWLITQLAGFGIMDILHSSAW